MTPGTARKEEADREARRAAPRGEPRTPTAAVSASVAPITPASMPVPRSAPEAPAAQGEASEPAPAPEPAPQATPMAAQGKEESNAGPGPSGANSAQRPQAQPEAQRTQRAEVFTWPRLDTSEITCIPIPKTTASYCLRCGQIATGTECHNCGQDFSETLRMVLGDEPLDAAIEGSRKRAGKRPAVDDDEDEGAFVSPAKRRREIYLAEAGVQLQLDLLRRERRRLNEARSFEDAVGDFTQREIYDPAAKAPEYRSPYVRRFMDLPVGNVAGGSGASASGAGAGTAGGTAGGAAVAGGAGGNAGANGGNANLAT
ncbi:hypothetical protein GGR51DRAFT_271466 [Nemania sp. FL0031]|nr:hypothetical protein GGR51DRAFT_271466 [Nemania sp. FL0031]